MSWGRPYSGRWILMMQPLGDSSYTSLDLVSWAITSSRKSSSLLRLSEQYLLLRTLMGDLDIWLLHLWDAALCAGGVLQLLGFLVDLDLEYVHPFFEAAISIFVSRCLSLSDGMVNLHHYQAYLDYARLHQSCFRLCQRG